MGGGCGNEGRGDDGGWIASDDRSPTDLADVRGSSEGLLVTLRRSTTDQEGRGRRGARPRGADPATGPVRVYQAWTAAGLTGGPLFRKLNRNRQPTARAVSPAYVARLVKRAAAAAGLDPTHYAGHSVRAGAGERAIMQQTGHTSRAMVDRSIRDGDLFRDNAAARIGV